MSMPVTTYFVLWTWHGQNMWDGPYATEEEANAKADKANKYDAFVAAATATGTQN